MKKLLTATLTFVALLIITSQASAQVATFNSLSLQFSNTVLTTSQYYQVLEGAKSNKLAVEEGTDFTKQHLGALPATGYIFGDNTVSEPVNVLAAPVLNDEPIATALENWITKELALQQPKRRGKH